MQPISSISGHAAGPNEAQPAQPRLVHAAHEFEAQMMKELLKPLNSSDPLTGDDSDSGSNGALGDFAAESLSQALSAHGGLGIADRIVHDLSHGHNSQAGHSSTRQGNNSSPAAVTAKVHGDTG